MKLQVAIIDDEIHAIETLIYDLKEDFHEQVEIVFTSTNPVDGIKKIKSQTPDLVFLDIEMPGLSGIDVLSLVDDLDVLIVITTAHEEFAIKTVGTKAIAYLLKPVETDNIEKIITKAIELKQNKKGLDPIASKIAVPVYDGIEMVGHDEIVYCKSDGNYSILVLNTNNRIVASKTLKYLSSLLLNEKFVRVHKSFLINIDYVKKYLKQNGGEIQMKNNDIIPVSRNKREKFIKLIQNGI